MPAYDAAATLARAVASVQGQTRGDWELLIAEDAARDDTRALADALAGDDPRIHVLPSDMNQGPAPARNRALERAQGRFIAFLDADDAWAPEKLTRQLAFMESTGAALSYTGFWRDDGRTRTAVTPPPTRTRAQLLRGNAIGCLTALYDREVFGKVPMPDLRHGEDYALWLRLLEQVPCAHGLTEPLATYYVQPGSHSAAKGRAMGALWGMYRQHLGLGRGAAAWYLAHHVAGRIKRG